MEPQDVAPRAVRVYPSKFNRVVLDVFTLGLYELWYRQTLYEVDGNHIRIYRGLLSRDEVDIPAYKVNGVKAKKSPLAGMSRTLIDTGAGKEAVAQRLTRQDAALFAAAVRAAHERAETLQQRSASAQGASVSDG